MMCFYDTEACEAYVSSHRKARKEHTCFECGKVIECGEVYHFVSGILDGPFTHKECTRCEHDRQRVIAHERAMGCRGVEADPGMGHLLEGLKAVDLDQTPLRVEVE